MPPGIQSLKCFGRKVVMRNEHLAPVTSGVYRRTADRDGSVWIRQGECVADSFALGFSFLKLYICFLSPFTFFWGGAVILVFQTCCMFSNTIQVSLC